MLGHGNEGKEGHQSGRRQQRTQEATPPAVQGIVGVGVGSLTSAQQGRAHDGSHERHAHCSGQPREGRSAPARTYR